MTGSGLRRTPLHEEHLQAGARMVDFSGWEMPVQYGSIVAEHEAVRTRAGLFDVSHMGEVELSGSAAAADASRLFTNDAGALAVGRAVYSLLVDDAGRILDDVIVYRTSPDRFLVCLNASNTERDVEWLSAHVSKNTTLTDRSAETALLALQGPGSETILRRFAPSVGALERFGVADADLDGVPALVARTGYTGEDGFELFCAAGAAARLWRALLERGREQGLGPAGLGARDTLRLEAALPLYGHELGEDVSPWEARVGWAVKLNRSDMIGHRALQSLAGETPKRRLIGLEIARGIARHGHPVMAGDRRVGTVTSGSHSPTLGRAIALALVNATAIDAELTVEVRGKRCVATKRSLPFVRRAR